jgi:hypothetical protein
MSNVEAFMEEVISDMRARLALLSDGGDRRAIEDGIALLTDYRLSEMDETLFERLLATLRAGRSPVGLAVLKPEVIGAELARRWQSFTQGGAIAAHG